MKYIGVLLLYPFLAILHGWVLSVMWGWYLSDPFGLPRLGLVEAIGLGLLSSMFTARYRREDEETPLSYTIVWSLTFPVFVLVFGWAWSFFR